MPVIATGPGRETCGEPEGCERPKEHARTACAEPGTTRELTDGVPEREVPLKAEGTGLLLPLLLLPVCLFRPPVTVTAMVACVCAE